MGTELKTNTLTFDEAEAIIKQILGGDFTPGSQDGGAVRELEWRKEPEDLKVYANLEDSWGAEGDGAPMGEVVKVTAEDGRTAFLAYEGTYSSWDSDFWHRGYLAESYEKKVTCWREVK